LRKVKITREIIYNLHYFSGKIKKYVSCESDAVYRLPERFLSFFF